MQHQRPVGMSRAGSKADELGRRPTALPAKPFGDHHHGSTAHLKPMKIFPVSPQLQVLLVDQAINFVAAIVILVVGWTIAGWAGRGVRTGLRRVPRLDATLRPLIASAVRYAIVILTIIAVLQRFGVETTSLIALLGAAGLALGLAIQGTLSNVAAGVMLIFLRPFRRGEKIEANKCAGVVRELGLFRTIIATDDGVFISIPNAAVFAGTIINYHRETLRRTNFIVPLDPTQDLEKVQAVVLDVLSAHPKVLKVPAPEAPIDSFNENAMNLAVQAWVPAAGFSSTRDDIVKQVQIALYKAGICFAQPLRAQQDRSST
jgi:small conductance mechanosensitive channel